MTVSEAAVAPDPSGAVDAENPWPGLQAFQEADRAFFRGRSSEVDQLYRKVSRSRLSVLFGVSGMGKTSLLKAGLFPRLRNEHVLPAYVRLDHSRDAAGYGEQIIEAVQEAAHSAGAIAPEVKVGESAWEYLHRRDSNIWGKRNRLLLPLLVFDQFEEIFTLAKSDHVRRSFFAELSGLAEGRPPDAVQARLDRRPDNAIEFAFQRHHYRILLTLREDFLPELDELRNDFGLDLTNRMRLRAMRGPAALEVVNAVEDLVAPSVAERIVRNVADTEPDRPLGDVVVELGILSVVCRELNLRRRKRGRAQITPDLLETSREEILRNFYEGSFRGLRPEVREFVEDRLLTVDNYRDSVALENALALPGVDRHAIDVLVDRRVLFIDRRGKRHRVELTHDVLAGVATAARQDREAAEKEEAARRDGWRRSTKRGLLIGVPLIAVITVGAVVTTSSLADSAERAYRAVLRSDLMNLASQEEIFYSDEYRYTSALDSIGFLASESVTLEVRADAYGWSARATHAELGPDRFCAIYYGEVSGVGPFLAVSPQAPGELACNFTL